MRGSVTPTTGLERSELREFLHSINKLGEEINSFEFSNHWVKIFTLNKQTRLNTNPIQPCQTRALTVKKAPTLKVAGVSSPKQCKIEINNVAKTSIRTYRAESWLNFIYPLTNHELGYWHIHRTSFLKGQVSNCLKPKRFVWKDAWFKLVHCSCGGLRQMVLRMVRGMTYFTNVRMAHLNELSLPL